MNHKLYKGDCLELMKTIKDKSVDIILCDLPYGVTARNKWDVIIPFNDFIIVKERNKEKIMCLDEYLLYCYKKDIEYKQAFKNFKENKVDGLWTHYNRIIQDYGVILLFAQAPFDKELALSNQQYFRYEWILEKTKATGHLNAKKMPMKAHEMVLVFYKKLPVYNPQMTKGHTPVHSYTKHTTDGNNYNETKTGICGGGSTDRYPRDILKFKWDTQLSSLHPTQKPVSLCEYLIKTYSNDNTLVLDNCMGSNSTGIACLNLNRNYIGIEKDDTYFDVCVDRTQKHIEENNIECELEIYR